MIIKGPGVRRVRSTRRIEQIARENDGRVMGRESLRLEGRHGVDGGMGHLERVSVVYP